MSDRCKQCLWRTKSGGIPSIPPGIAGGIPGGIPPILPWDPANPTWDPDRDFGTSHMGSRLESQVGSRQSHPRSQLHSRQNPAWNLASNPRWDPSNPTRDPSFVPCKIPPIPPSNLCFSRVGSRQSHLGSQICDR